MTGRSCSGRAPCPGINALLLGYRLYRSGLVPRIIPAIGLAGAPLLLGAWMVMFGVFDRSSVWAVIALGPIFVWELSLGVRLAIKGFRPLPSTTGRVDATQDRRGAALRR
jgi:hypothetical protein